MSSSTKRLIFLLAGAALFCIVSVGLAIGALSAVGYRLKESVSQDPTAVAKMAHEFIYYETPKGYVEQMGMDFVVYKFIVLSSPDYAYINQQPLIMLANFLEKDIAPEDMTRQLDRNARNQSDHIDFELVETRTVTIAEQEVALLVSEGKNKNGILFRRWVSIFEGRSGMVMLFVQGTADEWDEELLESFLASIHK